MKLFFWRPSLLTDEEMEAFFADRDGKWSRQTKAAIDFCLERILDILSPTDNSIAKDWRHRCRDRLSNEMGEAPSPATN